MAAGNRSEAAQGLTLVAPPFAYALLVLGAPLLTLLIVWAAASGVIELFASKKAAQHEVEGARDWRFVAIVTLAYAGLMALSPVVGLNDPVSLTGLLGAYAAVIGVFLLIGAASSALGAKATRTMSEVQ